MWVTTINKLIIWLTYIAKNFYLWMWLQLLDSEETSIIVQSNLKTQSLSHWGSQFAFQMLIILLYLFSLLHWSTLGPTCNTQRITRCKHLPIRDCSKVCLLPWIPHHWLCTCQMLSLQWYSSVVWTRHHMQRWCDNDFLTDKLTLHKALLFFWPSNKFLSKTCLS